jgi:hypothetical protein
MKRHERVGLPEKWMEPDCLNPTNTIKSVANSFGVVERQDVINFLPSQRVLDSSFTAFRYYYHDDLPNTRVWADHTVSFAEAYFFGDWRDRALTGNGRDRPPNRDWWAVQAAWQDEFAAAVLWGSVLGCWGRLARIASAIRDEPRMELDRTDQGRAWLIVVAGHLRGRSWGELDPFIATIQTGRRKREKLLLAWLVAIREGDRGEVDRAANEYAKFYLRTEAKIPETPAKLMNDGSFLYHLVARAGSQVILPSAIARDRLITLV